ncbi:MAG: hypothetical protein P1V97_00020 [Planctomycetota bacterium]|nr:hypothetical protein [Planctomycetota bacterium]
MRNLFKNNSKQNKKQHNERGNSLFMCLIISSVFITLSLTLITSVDTNRRVVTHNTNQFLAHQSALIGMQISVDMINEAFLDPISSILSVDTAGNIEGVGKSRSDPFVAGLPPISGHTRLGLGAIEDTIQDFREVPFTGIMPTQTQLEEKPNGYFFVQAKRIQDSWELRIRGKWRKNVRRIRTLVTPEEGKPFRLGIYGTSSVVVDGPGNIDWINSEDLTDIDTPIVLDSGGNMTVVKDPDNTNNP